MTALANSLASRLWPHEVLRALGSDADGQEYPILTDCPVCRGQRLYVFEDGIKGGGWHHCMDCLSSGDMAELAAHVWEVSPSTALERLAAHGAVPLPDDMLTPEKLARYEDTHVAVESRFRNLWAYAQEYLPPNRGTLGYLRNRFGLATDVSVERWRAGPAHLIGAAPAIEVEKAFCPGSVRPNHVGRHAVPHNPSVMAVFRGRAWHNVLVLPHYDLPDRICGFLFVGRGGDERDRIYQPMRINTGSSRLVREAGIYGLPVVLQHEERTVFAVEDPLVALRLHMRHFHDSMRMLPLVGWVNRPEARTKNAWRCLSDRTIVFWGWQMTPQLLRQAIAADGHVVLAGPHEPSVQGAQHYLRLHQPRELLSHWKRKALPWPDALRRWAKDATEGAVTELVASLSRQEIGVEELEKILGRYACKAAGALRPQPSAQRAAKFGAATVIESRAGWFCRAGRKQYQISNTILRIQRCYADAEGTWYEGEIIRAGDRAIGFKVPFAALESNAVSTVRDICIDKKLRLVQIDPRWEKRFLSLALALHTPVVG